MEQQQEAVSTTPSAVSAAGPSELIWCEYAGAPGTTAPVHIELGSADIARQISQQMHVQYTLNAQGQMVVHQLPASLIQQQQQQQQTTAVTTTAAAAATTTTTTGATLHQQHGDITVSQVLQEMNVIPCKQSKPRTPSVGERVPCQHCDKTFSCGANLRDHMRLHTGEKPFKCTECDMVFAQRSNWRLHKRVHTGEKPYMCGICGKTFARSSHLPGHMRIHTGEKPYKCDICYNYFPSTQALKNHTRTHTGEKPFKCSYCETAFTHSSSLSSHKKKCNGIKRKRGRPTGTGRKPMKKKQPSGRPRGRPKKKLRSGRGRKRLVQRTPDVVEDAQSIEYEQPLIQFKKEIVAPESNAVMNFVMAGIEAAPSEDNDDPPPPPPLPPPPPPVKPVTPSVARPPPPLAVRESVRLKIKQETKKANEEYLRSLKTEPEYEEVTFTDEAKYYIEPHHSIVIGEDQDTEGQEHLDHRVILEHNVVAEDITDTTCHSAPPPSALGEESSNHSSDLQQEAAVTMTTLHHHQQHHPSLNSGQLVTFVNHLTQQQQLQLQQQQQQQQQQQLQHIQQQQNAVSLPPSTAAVPVQPAAPQHYVTYQVHGSDVHVPVPIDQYHG